MTAPPPLVEAPDVVLHAAAWTDVDGAEADPQGAAAVNVGGTRNVAIRRSPALPKAYRFVAGDNAEIEIL